MTVFRFRLLLSLYIILCIAQPAVGWHFSHLIPPAMQAAWEAEPHSSDVANFPLSLSILLPLAIGSFAGVIGMFTFKSWARSFSLYFTVAIIIVLPFSGPWLFSWLDYILVEITAMVWGAVMALAYYSPVSSQFSRPQPGQ
ncbi:hypothetical protein [Massilia pseudoviolaceinigra]|uniref:hypothetical protein n=1 Tax=Massilia pseudoviolaceinigra TaxID=3057165 RepID=UPI002796D0E4|nr:hypothetical protein [Massilia sp. CCM 9206]MDQ1921319.1 hypothetical protein [Massilia sp. CCM 9206]